jgi:hypothetical protein
MNKFFLYAISIPFLAFGQYSQFASSSYSAGSAEYLKRPAFAQSAALCGAVVAWRENLAGSQFNPAIYDAVPDKSIFAKGTYSFMTLDRKHPAFDAAVPIGDYIAAGLLFVSYGVGDIEARDSFGNQLGMFSNLENSVTASVAGMMWNISAGASVRYLSAGMHNDKSADANLSLDEQAHGVGVDLGATWEALPRLCVGLSVQNLVSKLWWSTGHSDPVLTVIRAGVCGTFLKKSLMAEIDVVKPVQQPEELSLGLQYTMLNMFSLRGGISSAADLSVYHSKNPDYALGVGFRYLSIGIDYVLVIPDSQLGLSHKVSLVIELENVLN